MSLARIARIGGALYLVEIALGIFAEAFVRGKLVDSSDAAATSAHILLSQGLWRAGFVADLTMLVCDVVVTLALYAILRPVHRHLALVAAAFSLVTDAIQATCATFHLAPLLLLTTHHGSLRTTAPEVLQGLVHFALQLRDFGNMAGLVFFGVHCALVGFLIAKLPGLSKPLGVVLVLAGLCYLVNSLAWFLVPSFAGSLYPTILLPCLVAELSLALWLLFSSHPWSQAITDPGVSEVR